MPFNSSLVIIRILAKNDSCSLQSTKFVSSLFRFPANNEQRRTITLEGKHSFFLSLFLNTHISYMQTLPISLSPSLSLSQSLVFLIHKMSLSNGHSFSISQLHTLSLSLSLSYKLKESFRSNPQFSLSHTYKHSLYSEYTHLLCKMKYHCTADLVL